MDIYRLALDVAQVISEQSIYIDVRIMHVEVVRSLGMNAIHHINTKTTRDKLPKYGLTE